LFRNNYDTNNMNINVIPTDQSHSNYSNKKNSGQRLSIMKPPSFPPKGGDKEKQNQLLKKIKIIENINNTSLNTSTDKI